jgi:hypothetical protein
VIPNKAKGPGVARYKLIGNDQKNAININTFLAVKEEKIAKQAGRNDIMKVLIIVSEPIGGLLSAYGLKKLNIIHIIILKIPANDPNRDEIFTIIMPPNQQLNFLVSSLNYILYSTNIYCAPIKNYDKLNIL